MQDVGPNVKKNIHIKAHFARKFEMRDLGAANQILRMKIHRDKIGRKIWLTYKSYIQQIM